MDQYTDGIVDEIKWVSAVGKRNPILSWIKQCDSNIGPVNVHWVSETGKSNESKIVSI